MSEKLILVLNCGSSSLKFSVINSNDYIITLKGIIEFSNARKMKISWTINQKTYCKILNQKKSYSFALNFILVNILRPEPKIFRNIVCIGHRVVHGGSKISTSVFITEDIIEFIIDAYRFAPLHNPSNVLGIRASFNAFPNLKNKNIAVFDTAFHSTLPKMAYLYAIPYKFYEKYGIRKYGAHGISYQYSMYKSSKILNIDENCLNLIICHLGSGASISAIRNGICIDTSMGLTPLEGLVMGTRSGDIDPSIIFFMYHQLKMSIDEINDVLIHESGLLGLSGFSSDFRDLECRYNLNKKIKMAIDIFCYRLAKYISSYMFLMEGKLHAIVFTGGIGENSTLVRKNTLSKLISLGIKLDLKSNLSMLHGREGFINVKNTLPILVIPANEELVIAKESFFMINQYSKK